ncbi:unnamed protein product [Dicrocoelium dendriticum]|nr:unnamed protein product [Dicrocoelium dendriticum]
MNDYISYFIRDVITESEVPLGPKQETFGATGSGMWAISTDSENNSRGRADQKWPIGSIATLRFVAMHRAAAALQESLKPPFPSDSHRFTLDKSTSPISLSQSIP